MSIQNDKYFSLDSIEDKLFYLGESAASCKTLAQAYKHTIWKLQLLKEICRRNNRIPYNLFSHANMCAFCLRSFRQCHVCLVKDLCDEETDASAQFFKISRACEGVKLQSPKKKKALIGACNRMINVLSKRLKRWKERNATRNFSPYGYAA